MNTTLPDELYHYTSMDGCKGILETETLWMVNHKNQEDEFETISHDKVIIHFLEESNDNSRLKYPLSLLFPKFKFSSDTKFDNSDYGLYLTCFSDSFVNETLWSNYADDNKGAVICIDRDKSGITPPSPCKINRGYSKLTNDIVGMTSCQKVDYQNKTIIHDRIIELVNSCSPNDNPIIESLYSQIILNQIYDVIYCLKLENYAEEQEHRLYVPYDLTTSSRLGIPRDMGGRTKKILEFPLSHDCIKKIGNFSIS